MRLIRDLQRTRLTLIMLALSCVMLAGVALWNASRLPAEAASVGPLSRTKPTMQERFRRGVGSEVKFASSASKPQQINDAVNSTADFIYTRSGLRMSEAMKQKLAEAESNVLRGNAKAITVEELTDNLTTVVTDRLATITDEEIRQAAGFSAGEDGQIMLRADGKWGSLTQKGLLKQARVVRDASRFGDSTLRSGLHAMIEEQANSRVSTLSTALPEQFGRAHKQGITPLQALLIAYSLATDDPLTDSRSDIQQMLIQKRIDARQTREQRKAQKNVSGRPYGPHGLLHPSDPTLVFNGDSVFKLLNLTEGGKK